MTLRLIMIAAASFIIKGFVFPFLLRRAIREAGTQHESEPFVGYIMSIISGVVMLGISLWLGEKLPLLAAMSSSSLIIPPRSRLYLPACSLSLRAVTHLINASAISFWKTAFTR